jgi:hypothetical protein
VRNPGARGSLTKLGGNVVLFGAETSTPVRWATAGPELEPENIAFPCGGEVTFDDQWRCNGLANLLFGR